MLCLLIGNGGCLLGTVLMLTGGVLSIMVGIDRGESVFGFLRLSAIQVMGLALQQLEEEEKVFFLRTVPVAGLLSLVGCFFRRVAFLDDWVSAVGRVNGFFGYANTMALFLILGIVIEEHCGGWERRGLQLILVIGLLATGSRTAFVIFCGYLAWNFIRDKEKSPYFLLAFLGIAGVLGLMGLSGRNISSMGRFLKISLNESTLQGRILYWEDAVSMLVKRPAGLGYMGYFYFQQAHQTGVYSVRFVHNEWLQWVLDYGMLAGAGLIICLYYHCKGNSMSRLDKEILSIVAIHSFFDFHLQFLTIVTIALLLLPKGRSELYFGGNVKRKRRWEYGLGMATAFAACLCFSVIVADYHAKNGNYKEAVRWNPLSAQYKQEYLLQSENLKTAEAYADSLLKGNKYLYTAYLMKSNAAAVDGRLDDFVINRRKVLGLRQYKIEEYEDYLEILFSWYRKACEERNWQEMSVCRMEIRDVPCMITEVRRKTRLRAYRIKEKPNLSLDRKYTNLITEIEGDTTE